MIINFAKYEGLGNDFIIIKNMDGAISLIPEQIAWLCDRHFGIGADGLIFARSSAVADFFMDYHNSDGTIAEMCGNGIRCYAKYLADEWMTNKSTIDIETRAGIKSIELVMEDGVAIAARVDMGEPVFNPAQIPMRLQAGQCIDHPLDIDGTTYRATCVSMGNPHVVLFVDDVRNTPVCSLGPKIETSEYFPNRTNVEFAQILGNDEIALRVWERGCGETLACGTGACAALVAASVNGKTGRSAIVHVPGGEMTITWNEDNRVLMEGAANRVFTGTVDMK